MIGKKILNYEIKSLLGEGGMGNVYLAEHVQLGRKVAVKMLHPRLASNNSLRERFKNEAAAMAHLQHPSIVALYDYMESEDGLFLIMEFVEGQELGEYIQNVSGPIAEEECTRIMDRVLSAFDYAHSKGVVHRDIKPSNILLTKEGDVKILDFGIAKLLGEDNSLTKTGTQMGTVLYMSPEQVRGEKVDHRSDIYSLGVTLFQMITGQAPYKTDTAEYTVYNSIVKEPLPQASSLYPGASSKIEKIIAKSTAKKTEDRYQTCNEFLKAFSESEEKVAAAATTVAATTTTTSAPKKEEQIPASNSTKSASPEKPKKKKSKLLLIGIIVIGVLGGGYVVWDQAFNNEGGSSTSDAEPETENSVYVLSSILNFRSEKNLDDNSIIEGLPYGERLELIGNPESPTVDGDLELVWQEAEWNGKKGWIAKTIDGQDVVGDSEKKEEFDGLFASEYTEDCGYGELKVWAYNELIAWMKNEGLYGDYFISAVTEDLRDEGLYSILSFKESRNPKDKDSPDEFVVMLESGWDAMAVYLTEEGNNSGYVAGYVYLPTHVGYLTKKKKGEEIPVVYYNGELGLEEINETFIGTADYDGVATGQFALYANEIEWIAERFVEAKGALNILSQNSDYGTVFLRSDDWYAWDMAGETDWNHYWQVENIDGNGFSAYEYKSNFIQSNKLTNTVYSEFKVNRYVTKDMDKAKLYIDTQQNRLLLYLRDDSQNSINFHGCVPAYLIEEYLLERDGNYMEEGC